MNMSHVHDGDEVFGEHAYVSMIPASVLVLEVSTYIGVVLLYHHCFVSVVLSDQLVFADGNVVLVFVLFFQTAFDDTEEFVATNGLDVVLELQSNGIV
jgi:hypothetical protein